ncbi:MAG TPA: hypothetical protein O0X27_04820 [Methanocorpusculum sp.]|nr:hypothetical protein [Methanocorpusculum sp.]
MITVQDYVALQAKKFAESDPEVVALYKEQQELTQMRNTLEAREKAFAERLAALGPYTDRNFRVTDMREIRVPNMDLIRKNFTDIWESAEPSDTYKIKALKAYLGCDKLNDMVKAIDSAEYDRQKTITLETFDKAAGDSSVKKKYLGTAYNVKFTPTKKTRIEPLYVPEMMKFPAKFGQNKLIEAEEGE